MNWDAAVVLVIRAAIPCTAQWTALAPLQAPVLREAREERDGRVLSSSPWGDRQDQAKRCVQMFYHRLYDRITHSLYSFLFIIQPRGLGRSASTPSMPSMPSLPSSRSSERLADMSSTRLAPREPREREREREPRGGGTQANFSSDRHHRRRDTEFLDQVGATYDTIALSTVLRGIRTLVTILTFLSCLASFVRSFFLFLCKTFLSRAA